MSAKTSIYQCKNCGNTHRPSMKWFPDGLVLCKCCGSAAYTERSTEEYQGCLMGYDHIRNYRFNDAIRTFEDILQKYPRSTEARWGYLQAYFGIIYLVGYNETVAKPTFCYAQDSASRLRFKDHDRYRELLELVADDPEKQAIYEDRQKAIDRAIETIKKDLRQKCQYDVFLCVKIGLATNKNPHVSSTETTEDFKLARELYQRLTENGLSVFCSQISRPEGIHYDEQIWSAMLRSRKLLVIGTRQEYLESTWVQCEWRRWAYLIDRLQIRDRNTFVACIPSENWADERPREWSELRVQVISEPDEVVRQLCKKEDATIATAASLSYEETVRDIRALIRGGQREEAERRLNEELTLHPGRGEFRFLRLRLISDNFRNLDAIRPEEVELACTCLEEANQSPRRNPDYLDYLEAQQADRRSARSDRQREARLEKQQEKQEKKRWKTIIKDSRMEGKRLRKELHTPSPFRRWVSDHKSLLLSVLLFIIIVTPSFLFLFSAVACRFGQDAYAEERYEKAVGWYQTSAFLGDDHAQFGLGLCYYYGYETTQDYAKAVKWFTRAAEDGYDPAQNWLGYCYANGQGVEQSAEQAVRWYTLAAEQGNHSAQENLGDCYANGEGVEQNASEAIRWYMAAAEQGNAEAQLDLGNCYADGTGVERNYTEAIRWYTAAAEQKNYSAQMALGNLYYKGDGVERNYIEAAKWYAAAVEQAPVPHTLNRLGHCYSAEQNYGEAVRWYSRAAELHYAPSQINLGACYYYGRGVEQNYAEAVRLFTLAADQGDPDGMDWLGYCYYHGKGVEQNYAEAVRLFTLAADQGNTDAQCNLGSCYYSGNGVEQNYEEAVRWYTLAAEQGDADAQYSLGYCYDHGQGVAQNTEEAVRWYTLAAEQGHQKAQEKLDSIQSEAE